MSFILGEELDPACMKLDLRIELTGVDPFRHLFFLNFEHEWFTCFSVCSLSLRLFLIRAEKKMLGKKKVAQISMPFSKFMPDGGAAGAVETVTGSMGSLVLF